MTQQTIEIELVSEIARIGEETWDACACPETQDGGRPLDPFTTYRFLSSLERSGSVGEGTGWQPHHLVARLDHEVIAVAPMYGKSHSQGEYIFDHNWAHAFERAGGRYYPKLQIAVPFTPASGRRFLTRPGFETVGTQALVQGAIQIARNNGLSSLHVTFCTEDEAARGARLGLMRRTSQQFHWTNRGFADFDEFLSSLNSRKRKTLRKERATALGFGGEIVTLTGAQIKPHHWDHVWAFYQDTGARKWGSPYLTRAFFDLAQEHLCEDIALVLAQRDEQPVAGALNFIGREALFGRYWGCREHHPCLHFELCYYQAIDFALQHGLQRVEAGAQGDHKLARGYLPARTHSLHWVSDAGFAEAIGKYLAAESAAVAEDIEVLTAYGPFRKVEMEEQE